MIKHYTTTLLCTLCCLALYSQPNLEKQIQTQLITAEDGDVIELPAGRIQLTGSLWLDEKKHITIRGKGEDKTILSFKNQTQGAEGIKVTNASHILLENFTVEDSKGDLVKTQMVNHITFRNITARWTGKPKASNGSYALYPVQCTNVHIESCTAIGASDAGIYVGQSDSVWVTKSTARNNVAGIEIENTTNAWVSENIAEDNTGGILVFDLPDLMKEHGGNCHVWNNQIRHNNYRNFAPKGNIVGQVPPGTGVMILATSHVDVHDNQILNNKTVSVGIVSYYITEIPINDKTYNPYPAAVTVRNNTFSTGKRTPTFKNKMGVLFFSKFGRKTPHILYDGILNPDYLTADGQIKPEYRICVYNNQNENFANLKADKGFKHISKDLTPHRCK